MWSFLDPGVHCTLHFIIRGEMRSLIAFFKCGKKRIHRELILASMGGVEWVEISISKELSTVTYNVYGRTEESSVKWIFKHCIFFW
jgi:hypothetical protein